MDMHRLAWWLTRRTPAPRPKRRRRRVVAAVSGLAMCLLLPASFFQLVLYRQNLAMARERFPQAPAFSAHDRFLVISPHCDDETLGVGGTLDAARAAGAAVRVIFLTNGDGSRSTQIEENARHPRSFLLRRNSYQRVAAMRQHETTQALRELGIDRSDIVFLGYPDGGTQRMWEQDWTHLYRSPYTGTDHSPYSNSRTANAAYCGAQTLKDITDALAEWRPTVVFTTHPNDTHPDHWAAYAYTRAALETLRLRPATRAWAGQVRLLTFLVHRGWWPAPHGYNPNQGMVPPADLKNTGTGWVQAPLDRGARRAKRTALERYRSQLAFTPQFLRGFLRSNELFGVVPVYSVGVEALAVPHRAVQYGGAGRGAAGPASYTPLVQDAVHDSMLHDIWPAADLRSIAYRMSPAGDLSLSVELARPLTSRLSYHLSLHSVTGAAANARLIVVAWRGAAWHATVSGTEQELPMRLTQQGFTVDLKRNVLHLPQSSYSLLASAGTYLGSSCLDQTATGTLRITTRSTRHAVSESQIARPGVRD